jgi:ATP-binding protein involved in chromosome partitioning
LRVDKHRINLRFARVVPCEVIFLKKSKFFSNLASHDMITESQIQEALRTVKYPGFSRDIVSFGLVKGVQLEAGQVTVKLTVQTRDPAVPQQIQAEVLSVLTPLCAGQRVQVEFDIKEPPTTQGPSGPLLKQSIDGVKHIIAVASGKGGVGKSTTASNLAVALAATGAKVGLCDCDLYGPSIAHMFGSQARPLATDDNEIIPIEKYGLKLMSMGFLLDDDSPVIVRGPMATRYTQQFLRQVVWGELDYLVLDLPPGTGDIQLTIVQTVALDGAVIVTTPQEVALIDARKAVAMFAKVNVPILGMIENMSYFLCPSDGVKYHLFGEGGGRREAERLGVPLLGEVPLEMPVRESGDAGQPIALTPPHVSASSAVYHQIAQQLLQVTEK